MAEPPLRSGVLPAQTPDVGGEPGVCGDSSANRCEPVGGRSNMRTRTGFHTRSDQRRYRSPRSFTANLEGVRCGPCQRGRRTTTEPRRPSAASSRKPALRASCLSARPRRSSASLAAPGDTSCWANGKAVRKPWLAWPTSLACPRTRLPGFAWTSLRSCVADGSAPSHHHASTTARRSSTFSMQSARTVTLLSSRTRWQNLALRLLAGVGGTGAQGPNRSQGEAN